MTIGFVLVSSAVGHEREVHAQLGSLQGIVEVTPIFGEHDFIAKIEAEDWAALGQLVIQGIRRIAGVEATVTLTTRKA